MDLFITVSFEIMYYTSNILYFIIWKELFQVIVYINENIINFNPCSFSLIAIISNKCVIAEWAFSELKSRSPLKPWVCVNGIVYKCFFSKFCQDQWCVVMLVMQSTDTISYEVLIYPSKITWLPIGLSSAKPHVNLP